MKKEVVKYQEGDVVMLGYCANDETQAHPAGKKPVVMVVHDWTGRNPFAEEKAEALAALGYIGFAVDMFGDGITAETKEGKAALIGPLVQDRPLLQRRMRAALATAGTLPGADPSRIAAMGFCFGGLCVLDLARTGADLKGVVSFHGLLLSAPNLTHPVITAKILALHGYDDPMVSHEAIIGFADEMTEAKANWEFVMYGNTMHGFTNPEARDPVFGTVFQPQSNKRAWDVTQLFLKEIF